MMRFDRSWIPAILAVLAIVVISNQIFRLPYELVLVLGAAIAGWIGWSGVRIWQQPFGNQRRSGPRVQYWRGQRYELQDEPRRTPRFSVPPWPQAVAAVILALTGSFGLIVIIAALVRRFS